MAKRDSFLLRIDPKVLRAVRSWADDEMRSVNAQIEYLLRDCVRQTGRLIREEEVDPEVRVEKDDASGGESDAPSS